MERIVNYIAPTKQVKKRKKVCAYARVSKDKDEMLNSLSNQVSHYNKLINSNPEWEFAGVYSDYAISGTKEDREEFNKMIEKALNGEIDMIITKSISRSARNTEVLLDKIRLLKRTNVDVYFEEQKIHTISSDGELMLSFLAAYYQEEARSVSENMKWCVKKNFENGIPWNVTILGYRFDGIKLIVEPTEAGVVKFIYQSYLDGLSIYRITKFLSQKGIMTRLGNTIWTSGSVRRILTNYAYTGNLILQTTFRDDYLTKKKRVNNGEVNKYLIEDSHEAIIPLDTWSRVQNLINASKEKSEKRSKGNYLFTGLIRCGCYGKLYTKANGYNKRLIWRCPTFNSLGKKFCQSQSIRDDILQELIAKELKVENLDRDIVVKNISEITMLQNNELIIKLLNDEKRQIKWEQKSRSESWNEYVKKKAKEKSYENSLSKKRGGDGKWLKSQ